MSDTDIRRGADRLINEIFIVKEGENVLLTRDSAATESTRKVMDEIAKSVVRAGAFPVIIEVPEPNGVGKAADPDIALNILSAATCSCDVWMEFCHKWLLYSTPFERAEAENKKIRFMSLNDFDEALLTRTIANVETDTVQTFMKRVRDLHLDAKEMRITTPAGTDVTFELDPNHFVACDCGECREPGIHMLTGQLNVVPKFGSINGKIVFDGTITPPLERSPKNPVELVIKEGVIVEVNGDEDAKTYDEWLHSFNDEGMLKMAHVAYGFNPGAALEGAIVEDERVWGVTEWGIGYVSPFDAPPVGQAAVSHSDGICTRSSVWVDGRQILDEGEVVDEELKKLAPR